VKSSKPVDKVMSDKITISRLQVPVYLGVPDEEREFAQSIEITLDLYPERSLFGTHDDIEQTVNYYEVSQRVIALVQERPRKLIELLNEEVLQMLLREFPLERVSITTYKYILPNTEHVAVSMTLTKESA